MKLSVKLAMLFGGAAIVAALAILYRLALCAAGRLALGSGKVVSAPAPATLG